MFWIKSCRKPFCCCCFLVLGITLPVLAEQPRPASASQEDAVTNSAEDQLLPQTIKNKYPYLEVHGDYRWLWGEGKFSGQTKNPFSGSRQRQNGKVILNTRRLRLFPFYHLNPQTSLRLMLEDNRNDQDHTSDRHLYLNRAYLQHERENLKLEAGRFNYYLLDGNVIDKRVDGLRLRLGSNEKPSGSLTFFAGQTVESDDQRQKRGLSLLYRKKNGRLSHSLAYLNFYNKKSQPQNLRELAVYGIPAGRFGQSYDRQQIGEWLVSFQLTPKWRLSWDGLTALGQHKRDHYSERQSGFVTTLEYGQLQEEKRGSHRFWLRYYDQPSATILYHTMDADTGFFRRLGFQGVGARLDYVLRPGLALAIEGFTLKNRREADLGGDFKENVLGTSLTAYF